jgi:hypothetical protein
MPWSTSAHPMLELVGFIAVMFLAYKWIESEQPDDDDQ